MKVCQGRPLPEHADDMRYDAHVFARNRKQADVHKSDTWQQNPRVLRISIALRQPFDSSIAHGIGLAKVSRWITLYPWMPVDEAFPDGEPVANTFDDAESAVASEKHLARRSKSK